MLRSSRALRGPIRSFASSLLSSSSSLLFTPAAGAAGSALLSASARGTTSSSSDIGNSADLHALIDATVSSAAETSNDSSNSNKKPDAPKKKKSSSNRPKSSRASPRIVQEKPRDPADDDIVKKDEPKVKVGVLQPHAEGTWADDSVRCSPAIYASDKLQRRFEFEEFTIRKNSSFRQLRQLTSEGRCDVFWNMCDGARDEVRPGEDTLRVLESLNVPFTGADSSVFEPSKIEMKMLLAAAGIRTPNFAVLDRSDVLVDPDNVVNNITSSDETPTSKELQIDDKAATNDDDIRAACSHLRFPVIVKHISGYGSIGITKDSKCANMSQLIKKLRTFVQEYDVALVEEFVTGEEGTVLVCPDPGAPTGVHVFPPLMIPIPGEGGDFLHYGNKWKSSKLEDECFNFFLRPDGTQLLPREAHIEAKVKRLQRRIDKVQKQKADKSVAGAEKLKVPTIPAALADEKSGILTNAERAAIYNKVQRMAANAFVHIMQRVGYGRCDFRIDSATKEPYFLEVNPNCGIFLPCKETGKPKEGEGDYADLMIQEDKAWGADRFIRNQLDVAMQHNKARTPWWCHSYSNAERSFITKATRFVPKYTRVFGDAVRPVPVVARALFDAVAVDERAISVGNSNSHKNVSFLEEEEADVEEDDDDDDNKHNGNDKNGGGKKGSNSSSKGNMEKTARLRDEIDTPTSLLHNAHTAHGGKKLTKAQKLKLQKELKVGCAVFRGDGLQTCVLLAHSCAPNCALVHSNTIELAAVLPIKKGEPLSIDYGSIRDPAMPSFRCRCGEPGCRKWIHSQPVSIRAPPATPIAAAVAVAVTTAPAVKPSSSSGGSKKNSSNTIAKKASVSVSVDKKSSKQKQQQQQRAVQKDEGVDEEADEVEPVVKETRASSATTTDETTPKTSKKKKRLLKRLLRKQQKAAAENNERAVGLASAPPAPEAPAAGTDGAPAGGEEESSVADAKGSDARTEQFARDITRKTRLLLLKRAKNEHINRLKKNRARLMRSTGTVDPIQESIRQKLLESRRTVAAETGAVPVDAAGAKKKK